MKEKSRGFEALLVFASLPLALGDADGLGAGAALGDGFGGAVEACLPRSREEGSRVRVRRGRSSSSSSSPKMLWAALVRLGGGMTA